MLEKTASIFVLISFELIRFESERTRFLLLEEQLETPDDDDDEDEEEDDDDDEDEAEIVSFRLA